MPGPKEGHTRMSLDLPRRMHDQVGELAELTGAQTRGEVVRRALALYDVLVHEQRRDPSGRHLRVFVRDPDDPPGVNEREVIIP